MRERECPQELYDMLIRMKAKLDNLAARLTGLLYDNRCPSCEGGADAMSLFPLCTGCFRGIVPYTGPACSVCARPFVSRYSDRCGDCLSREPEFERALSFGLYEGALMHAIHLMKFGGVRRLARPMSSFLSEISSGADFDIMVPVPMTKRGLMARGFNQTALMARELAGPRLRLDALRKIKETPAQVGLSRKARLKNLKGAFGATDEVRGMRVAVLDDVITTGATMRECAKALKRAGAEEVLALSLARTY